MLFNDNFLSFAEARQKCQTALQLAFDADRHLSDTFALQGMIQIYFERNWQEAKKSLAHAVRFGNLLRQPVLAGSIKTNVQSPKMKSLTVEIKDTFPKTVY